PPASNIQYSSFDLPFPASDRDFVFRNDFTVDEKIRGVVIDVKSVNDKRSPEREGIVRGEIVRGRYILIPLGDKTLFQAEYLADPKGSIPVW
ncbi:START domain-containing protein, partial [Escherichia coli]|uniref:START domain-containing protein n=1 Tax=Escherichia coli TaxID=562 RepID=UPI003862BACE